MNIFKNIKFRDKDGKIRFWVWGALWGAISYPLSIPFLLAESSSLAISLLTYTLFLPFWVSFRLLFYLSYKGFLAPYPISFVWFTLPFYVLLSTCIGSSFGYLIEKVLKGVRK